MKTSELEYDLPKRLIAQRPAPDRDAARLLVLDRAAGTMQTDVFRNVANYLHAGDCLVLNDTRVIRARLHGQKLTGGRVEVFLLREETPGEWDALVRPSSRVKPGTVVPITNTVDAVIGDRLPNGRRRVTFNVDDVLGFLERTGEVPLPPYVRRPRADEQDQARYQTIYARHPGAVAAPTAGLHFTDDVFASLDAADIRRTHLTLHVGYGTFRPIQTDCVADHHLESEYFDFPEAAAGLF